MVVGNGPREAVVEPDTWEPAELRGVFGRFTTGVTVITTLTARGPVGMTANSFTPVSLEPPLVLFCVSRRSQLCEPFATARSFAVNVLADTQRPLSARFAAPGYDRFGDTPWRPGHTGVPLLPGALAVVECETAEVLPGGDHVIVLGRVVAVGVAPAGEPLVFYGSRYRRLW